MPGPQTQEPASARQEYALWCRFRETREPELRERLIELYRPFAKQIAGHKYATRSVQEVEFDDYMQYALVGLIEAVDRFDPDRGAQFKTYAAHRIKGAISNGLSKYSEHIQQRTYLRAKYRERVQSLRDQRDEGQELFDELASLATRLALGYLLEDSNLAGENSVLGATAAYQAQQMEQARRELLAIVEALPERERQIVSHHYYEGRNFSEIGELLGLSKARISQLHGQALETIKAVYSKLEAYVVRY